MIHVKMELLKLGKYNTINPDLASERVATKFNVRELTTIIDGSEEYTKDRHKLEKLLSEDVNIPNPLSLFALSSDDYYRTALETQLYVDKTTKGLSDTNKRILNSSYIRVIFAPCESPLTINRLTFVPDLLNNSSSEQLTEWFPLIENGTMKGCYAQTEMSHGSDIKRLETTAIYDVNTEEFILNSPSLTSIKMWSGGLGRTATHAIVMAQLYIKDICYGIHMFLVQVRDNNHSTMPGVTVGELGSKMGLEGLDNGYLHLNNIRIPRKNMLMKHSNVLKDGTYVKSKFDRSNYGSMVYLRTVIVNESAVYLAQVVTIAVRYNAVRRQGKIENEKEDVKILDYKTQQFKLFPQVALAYAYFFVSKRLFSLHSNLRTNTDREIQVEFHALSSGLKALSTSTSAKGAEICRRACGGLGYLHATRLPNLCMNLLASCTYEGDNTILELQTARYLMKSIGLINAGKQIGETVEYLRGTCANEPYSCLLEYLNLFETTNANLLNEVSKTMNFGINSGKRPEIIWQNLTLELVKCAQLHSQIYVIQSLHLFLLNTELSASLHTVLTNLFQLLAIYWILESSGDFMEYGNITNEYVKRLRSDVLSQLLQDLRNDIVSLVDAFDFCDAALQSVIGSYDGRAYERLFEYWSKLPNNENQKRLKSNQKSNL